MTTAVDFLESRRTQISGSPPELIDKKPLVQLRTRGLRGLTGV